MRSNDPATRIGAAAAGETRVCYRCGLARPVDQYIHKSNGTLYDLCSPCLSEILATGRRTGPRQRLVHTATDRTCYLCLRVLPNEQFTQRTTGSFFSACKACNTNVFAHRRRARLLQVGGTFTTAEWLELLARHPRCPGPCSRRWEDILLPPRRKSVVTRDHVVPVSKGGRNVIGNIQPLCYSCNSRKGDREG